MTSSDAIKEGIPARLASLEEEVEQLREENQEIREENQRLRGRLRWYEGPHTPPSKDQPGEEESSSSG